MWAELAVFVGGFAAPVPVALLILAVVVVVLGLRAAEGRVTVGLDKAVARREWDTARRRRAELAAVQDLVAQRHQ
ncbi:MAG: hypothetical protein LBU05_03745 [Bifidobacteriaceae bacterium]|jgi:hypothetical protein|nr:hypothetical protein [Bifidobacteriaceae bacterium]